MKRLSVGFERVVLGVALSAVIAAGSVWAQASRLTPTGPRPAAGNDGAGSGDEKVRIDRFPQPGKTSMIRTPEFSVNVSGLQAKVNTRPRFWALLEIKYTTGQKWTDELVFTYHVMTKGKDDDGKDMFSYYTLPVRYIDIPKGSHMSCVALPPSLVERYGEPISLALEITGREGTVLDSKQEGDGGKEWWKDPKVMDQSQIKRRQGLVDRSKTPFALIHADDYEVVQ